MDSNPPLKTTEEFNEEDGAYQVDKMDLNSYQTKEEYGVDGLVHEGQMRHEGMRVYSNEGYVSPPILLCKVNEEENQYKLESTLEGSSLPVTELEKTKREVFSYGIENVRRLYEEHEHDGDIITAVKVEIGDSIHHHPSFSDQGDNDDCNLIDREYYEKTRAKSSTPDEGTNHNYSKISVEPQLEVNEVNEEMDDKNNIKSCQQSQMRVVDYSYDMATPENIRMVWETSCLQSQETQNVSPSPERQLSVSAERSPHIQSPPKGHTSPKRRLSASLSAPSPLFSRRRHSPSPQKPSLGDKGASSSDHSSPSRRPKSLNERELKSETRHKIYSPRRYLSPSPRKHDSPRRRGRFKSKSPTRRRGSFGCQKDPRCSRSRSPQARNHNRRSPLARNHNRRSPRRQSPRNRSPPNYHSRRHPPRRPWSPPINRNTGIGRPGKNLFIAGFSYLTTESDLKKKFSEFGRVTDVRVVRDRRSGDSRGFGFLSLERDEDADAAIHAVNQTEWNGRIVLVEKSKTSH